jgi:hypothetical protein
MTNTRAKFSWEGDDVVPFPRSPVSLGTRKKNPKAASVPIETVSSEGCSLQHWVQLGPILGSFFWVKRCRINELVQT